MFTIILGDVSNRGGGGGGGTNSRRSLGLAASAKILTRAANWRAKSLQAKTERRERRATKTLAIVLGMLETYTFYKFNYILQCFKIRKKVQSLGHFVGKIVIFYTF